MIDAWARVKLVDKWWLPHGGDVEDIWTKGLANRWPSNSNQRRSREALVIFSGDDKKFGGGESWATRE